MKSLCRHYRTSLFLVFAACAVACAPTEQIPASITEAAPAEVVTEAPYIWVQTYPAIASDDDPLGQKLFNFAAERLELVPTSRLERRIPAVSVQRVQGESSDSPDATTSARKQLTWQVKLLRQSVARSELTIVTELPDLNAADGRVASQLNVQSNVSAQQVLLTGRPAGPVALAAKFFRQLHGSHADRGLEGRPGAEQLSLYAANTGSDQVVAYCAFFPAAGVAGQTRLCFAVWNPPLIQAIQAQRFAVVFSCRQAAASAEDNAYFIVKGSYWSTAPLANTTPAFYDVAANNTPPLAFPSTVALTPGAENQVTAPASNVLQNGCLPCAGDLPTVSRAVAAEILGSALAPSVEKPRASENLSPAAITFLLGE